MNTDAYDLVVAGISGGKDSTALALWLCFESGIQRDRIRLEFCDTGNEDALTYEFLEYLRTVVGEIHVVMPDMDFWKLARHKKRFPSRMARFCTQHLKVMPSHDSLAAHMDSGKKIIKATGVRWDEAHASNDRGEVPEIAYDGFDIGKGKSKRTYIYPVWYPLRAWTLDDVWSIHKRYLSLDAVIGLVAADPTMQPGQKQDLCEIMRMNEIPRNPLYDMGAQRVGCFPCINSAKREMRALAHYRPERIEFINEQEMSVANRWGYSGFFARSTVPLHFRSKVLRKDDEVLIDEETGEPMLVATIHDVVEWSKTWRGARQYEFFLPDEAGGACVIGGECE